MSWMTKESRSVPGWGKRLLPYKISRLDLGPTQPPFQQELWGIFPRGKAFEA